MPHPSGKNSTDNLYYFPYKKASKPGENQSVLTPESVPHGTVDLSPGLYPYGPETLFFDSSSLAGLGVSGPKIFISSVSDDVLHLRTSLANDDVSPHTYKAIPPVYNDPAHQQSAHGDDTEMMKDYVDAKLEASEARTREAVTSLKSDIDQKFAHVDVKFAEADANFSKIQTMLVALGANTPTKFSMFTTVWSAAITVIALVVGVLSFGFDRFDSGASIAPAIEQRVDQQMDRRFDELKDLIKQTSTSQPPSQSNNQP